MDGMTIGDLAKVASVPPRTIRFYEKKGVLPSPARSASGYRLYGPHDLKRVSLVRRARSLGFSLTEASNLVRLAEHEKCDSFQGEVAQLMMGKLAQVDAAIQQLSETRRELEDSLRNLNGGDCQHAVLMCGCDCMGT